MKKGFSISFLSFLFVILLCNNLNAQTGEDKYLQLLLRNGLETTLLLKEHPSITFFDDSIKIASKKSYAIAKRADIRTITFTTDVVTTVAHSEISTGKYYRVKGVSGKYINVLPNDTQGKLSLNAVTDDNIKETIFYFDNSSFLSYATGTYIGNSGMLENIGQNEGSWNTVVSEYFSDKFMLHNSNNTLLSDNGAGKLGIHSGKSTYSELFTFEEITELPVTISNAKYATLYAPVALEIAEEVTAYTATINADWVELTEITDGIIPAYTGVVLYAEIPDTYYFPITKTEKKLESDLRGSVATTYYTKQGAYYALAYVDGEVGFYRDSFNNNRFQNNSHKAFIYIPAASGVAYYGFHFNDSTTGIVDVNAVKKNSGIYDVLGRKINNIVMPGLYIVNGEKVLVK